MTKRKKTIAVATGIVLTAGVVWAVMMRGPDPEVEKVKQMQEEMFKQGTRPDAAKLAELRKAEEQLSPAQRQEVGRSRGEQFERRINETIATYFSLPPEKKKEFLDDRIKEMEKWRKAREADRGQGGRSGPPGGGGFGGSGMSSDARAARGLQRLDGMSASQRAQRQAFMADLNQRRVDQGLPPMGRRPLPPR